MIVRGARVLLALIMVLALAGCGGDDSSADSTDASHETPSVVVDEATQPASRVIDASPDNASHNPRQLAVMITDHVRNQKWDEVRPFLPDEVAALDDHLLHRALAGALVPAEIGTDVSDWNVEHHPEWTTVRLVGLPFVTLVFRERDDGTYLLDPGPHIPESLARYAEDATPGATAAPSGGYQPQIVAESADDMLEITRHMHRNFRWISSGDHATTLTVTWGFAGGASGQMPLDGLRWIAGDTEGPVEVVWTTAVFTDGALMFPVPDWEGDTAQLRPNQRGEGRLVHYTTSFAMIGAPTDTDLRLLVERMVLVLPDGDVIAFGIDHQLSPELFIDDASATTIRGFATIAAIPAVGQGTIVGMVVDFTGQVLANSQVIAYRYLAPDYRTTDPDLRRAFGMNPKPDTFSIRDASLSDDEGMVGDLRHSWRIVVAPF